MALSDAAKLALDGQFQARVQAQFILTCEIISQEVTNDAQTLGTTGTVTGGSFVVGTLPAVVNITQTGTLASTVNVTGLATTVGLFVGMTVTGTGIPANTTIATITGLTTLTLSAAATVSSAQVLTFHGVATASIPFNATAADVEAIIEAIIGSGNCVCTGGPLPGTGVLVTFCGTLAGTPQRLLTLPTNALTGGGSPTIVHTTPGVSFPNHTKRFALSTRMTQTPPSAQQYLMVATDSAVLTDYGAGGVNGQAAITDAHIANAVFANWNAFAG
jgi:hypothetical protein